MQLADLREKHFGTGEGTRLGASKHEGAETDQAMRLRVDRFLAEHVFPAAHDAVICVVAHGVILGVLCRALELASPGLWWSNTGYLEATLVGRKLTVTRTNCVDHLHGLKRTRGVGSAQYDDRQKTMDSFFKPKRRKLGKSFLSFFCTRSSDEKANSQTCTESYMWKQLVQPLSELHFTFLLFCWILTKANKTDDDSST